MVLHMSTTAFYYDQPDNMENVMRKVMNIIIKTFGSKYSFYKVEECGLFVDIEKGDPKNTVMRMRMRYKCHRNTYTEYFHFTF